MQSYPNLKILGSGILFTVHMTPSQKGRLCLACLRWWEVGKSWYKFHFSNCMVQIRRNPLLPLSSLPVLPVTVFYFRRGNPHKQQNEQISCVRARATSERGVQSSWFGCSGHSAEPWGPRSGLAAGRRRELPAATSGVRLTQIKPCHSCIEKSHISFLHWWEEHCRCEDVDKSSHYFLSSLHANQPC